MVSALLAILLSSPLSGRAEAAPCTNGAPALTLHLAPSPWLFGRPITPYLSPQLAAPGDVVNGVNFAFSAADPNHPISQPSSFQSDPNPVGSIFDDIYGVPLVLHKGDGSARLSASWTERDDSVSFGYTCERSASTVIEGTSHGERPHFKLRRSGNKIVFVDKSCPHENLARVGRVTIAVHGEGGTRSAHLNDQCDSANEWHPGCSIVRSRWDLCEESYEYVGSQQLTFFAHRGLGPGEHLFRATVRLRKRVLAVHTIRVTITLH